MHQTNISNLVLVYKSPLYLLSSLYFSQMDSSSSTEEEQRNWMELPRDVTLTILIKLTSIEILETAQFVCKTWYTLCQDPSMWLSIDMVNMDGPGLVTKHEKMLFSAVDRSSGSLLKLAIEGFGSDDLLLYVANRSSHLKCLRLACCYSISADALMEAFKKLPVLEELELTLCSFTEENTVNIIRTCPPLKTFSLNEKGSKNPDLASDVEALAIAGSMPELCHLQLIGNCMTDDGLKAILDGCPRLESLDLRACFLLSLAGNLVKRCVQQTKDFRHPYDATDDYYFHTTEYDSDFDEIYAEEHDDFAFMSDDDYYEFSDDGEFIEFV